MGLHNAHLRRSFLLHLWLEPRELVGVPHIMRGQATAIDTDRTRGFEGFNELTSFLSDELYGVDDPNTASDGAPNDAPDGPPDPAPARSIDTNPDVPGQDLSA